MTRANAVSARCDDLSRQAGPTRSWLESVLWRSPLSLVPPFPRWFPRWVIVNRTPFIGWAGWPMAGTNCLSVACEIWRIPHTCVLRWVTPPPFNSPHPPPPPPRLGLAEFPLLSYQGVVSYLKSCSDHQPSAPVRALTLPPKREPNGSPAVSRSTRSADWVLYEPQVSSG